jgi:hypothetical protein
MLSLICALLPVALPALYWTGGAETASTLRQAGITHISVPASNAEAWKNVSGIDARIADRQGAVKLAVPGITFRMSEASASRVPWVTSNGWQFIRRPKGRFYYDVSGNGSALAAAEAFCYGANSMIQTDTSGLKPLADILSFLASINSPQGPPLADIGFADDGSPSAGEVMNLLVRDNLLFKIVRAPDPDLKVMVQLGSKEYPTEAAKNPDALVHKIRANLTDARRLVRIYGTSVVVARITEEPGGLRLHLLNYGSAKGTRVEAFRVRLLGHYPKAQLHSFGSAAGQLTEYSLEPGATEFTVPELKMYAAIDLSK